MERFEYCNFWHAIDRNDTITMRSRKLIATVSSNFVSTSVNSSRESVHASSYNWPNFSASLVGRLSSLKSAIWGLLFFNLAPAILLNLWYKLDILRKLERNVTVCCSDTLYYFGTGHIDIQFLVTSTCNCHVDQISSKGLGLFHNPKKECF